MVLGTGWTYWGVWGRVGGVAVATGIHPLTGHLEKRVFSAIAASTPYSNPHILYVYCGSPCGVSLHSRKKRCFSRYPLRAPRKMRFFRDCCVSAVLESSYTLCILRFSVRRFLALTQKTAVFRGTLLRAPRKMRFFRDCCVSAVLESSYTLCILRFSVRRFPCTHAKNAVFRGAQ